ncbi:MAG TPA: hypothetical protein VK636_21145, partial [Gemmatimonadaceae bacterium]|nr:hypothetical protein [Gemmatimonadaceae bacterium]
ERRIRAIARRRDRVSRAARAVAAFIGVAAVTAAWAAPRPAASPRSASPIAPTPQATLPISIPPVERVPAALSGVVERPSTANAASMMAKLEPRIVSPAPIHDSSLNAPILLSPAPATMRYASSPTVDSVFNRLFTGITLTPDQEGAARQLIGMLANRQIAAITTTLLAGLSTRPAITALQTRRDSALRSLLTTDDDRAIFDARAAATGGRGRSGGAPGFGEGARGRVGGGGRIGRGGFAGDTTIMAGGARRRSGSPSPSVSLAIPSFQIGGVDAAFDRLLGGFALTPDQEATARTIIADARREMESLIPEVPMTELALIPSGNVLMRAESKATLLALLTNDADRALVDSRIALETRIVVRNPPGGRK